MYARLRQLLRDELPVALVTIVDGPGVGAKLLITGDGVVEGSLGHPELDRIAARDARAELEAGRSGIRADLTRLASGNSRNDTLAALFSEELGVVLQVPTAVLRGRFEPFPVFG